MSRSIFLVTPTLNSAETLDSTLWSILSQAGDFTLHYHIQDGGSQDETLEKIQFWETRIPALQDTLRHAIHFSYDSSPDRNMYDALNKGFSSFVMPPDAFMGWCNSDDALWPHALQGIAEIARDLPHVEWITGWQTIFDISGRVATINKTARYPDAVIRAGLADGQKWNCIQQESTFWKKSLWDAAGGLNAGLRLAGDWDLWVRFARHAPLLHVQRQLGSFWRRPGQLSSDMNAYLAEMRSLISEEMQDAMLRDMLKERENAFQSVSLYKDEAGGKWVTRLENPPLSAKILARLYLYAPGGRIRKKLLKKIRRRVC